jgi:putative ABC transport system substrate-binding protein
MLLFVGSIHAGDQQYAITTSRMDGAAYPWRTYIDHAGLMDYGVDVRSMWRRTLSYVDRILKGAKPTDLPVEEVSAFELVISRTSARELGIEVPQSLIARANEMAP